MKNIPAKGVGIRDGCAQLEEGLLKSTRMLYTYHGE
jgi:hypothetical protein